MDESIELPISKYHAAKELVEWYGFTKKDECIFANTIGVRGIENKYVDFIKVAYPNPWATYVTKMLREISETGKLKLVVGDNNYRPNFEAAFPLSAWIKV